MFSRSVFSVLFPFCLKYFTSYVDCFGCICFQFFPFYSFSATAAGISVLLITLNLFVPVPFDITSFSFTSAMTDRPQKQDWVPFAICTSPIIHLVCLQTFCIRIEFNFSWDDHNTQEKLKADVMQNFRRQTTCITRVVQMGNAVIEKRSLYQCVTFT